MQKSGQRTFIRQLCQSVSVIFNAIEVWRFIIVKLVSGIVYTYFLICKRKMWYFSRGISLEENNEDVAIGKLIDENSYSMDKKHIIIDNCVSIDFMKNQTIYEIKKSTRQKVVAIKQIIYYLYVLNQKGIKGLVGELRVPKENYIEKIIPTMYDFEMIDKHLVIIEEVLSQEKPPAVETKGICKKCAYYDFCYI